jgi:hypothetical protein
MLVVVPPGRRGTARNIHTRATFQLLEYSARTQKGKQWEDMGVSTSAAPAAGATSRPAPTGSSARDTGGTTAG